MTQQSPRKGNQESFLESEDLKNSSLYCTTTVVQFK
jgi:hypothetical protein